MKIINLNRICPVCNATIICKREKDAKYFTKKKIPCRECSIKIKNTKYNFNPKQKYNCLKCNASFEDWPSQLSNPETPFCSKACWYNSETKTLVGQTFGRLSVINRIRKGNTTFYECSCECGNKITTTHSNLLTNNCKSCSCLQKDLISERSIKPAKTTISGKVYSYYKRNAKMRNIFWNLSKKDVENLIFEPCFYCKTLNGTNTTNGVKRNKNKIVTLNHNGIDRFDNSHGYTSENSITCCKDCNISKNDMSFDSFKIWALRLAKNLPSINRPSGIGRSLGEKQIKKDKTIQIK